jgi:hypothetical protein
MKAENAKTRKREDDSTELAEVRREQEEKILVCILRASFAAS